MADFTVAIALVLAHEGGLSLDPSDPGGATKFGISQRAYPSLNISGLTRADAVAIYERDYWTHFNFGALESQAVANKIFDFGVNAGPATAIRILQEALGCFVAGPIVADGKLGSFTVQCAAQVPDEKLLPELRARCAVYHTGVAIRNPKELTDLLGWLRRDLG